MAFIIGGHPRSGTTLLNDLCNSHPDMTVTREFGNFIPVGRSYKAYRRQMLKRWRRKGLLGEWFLLSPDMARIDNPPLHKRGMHILQSHVFMLSYLSKMRRYRRRQFIDVPAIEATLLSMFPNARIVGDKYPGYAFILNRLVKADRLSCLIIYRDCRDVTSSTLKKVRTDWQGRPFAE